MRLYKKIRIICNRTLSHPPLFLRPLRPTSSFPPAIGCFSFSLYFLNIHNSMIWIDLDYFPFGAILKIKSALSQRSITKFSAYKNWHENFNHTQRWLLYYETWWRHVRYGFLVGGIYILGRQFFLFDFLTHPFPLVDTSYILSHSVMP